MRTLAWLASLLLASVCTASLSAQMEPGDRRIEVQVGEPGDRTRSFLLHVPEDATPPIPLVIAFHGGGGNAAGYQRTAGIDRVADREGFAVAYPDGTGRRQNSRRFLTWNAGDCCGLAHEKGSDDVAFARALIEAVAERIPLDRARVYATGHSNGAMMTYRVAAEAARSFAAVAPVAGSMNVQTFAPAAPVPILHIHSVDDPRASYAGGERKTGRLSIPHYDVEERLAQWRRQNGCSETSSVVERRVRDGHTAALYVWSDCKAGHEVRLWKLTGAGHGWPGGKAQLPERIVGSQTAVIDAGEEAWAFFRRFAREKGAN